jgi:hypothetical protein
MTLTSNRRYWSAYALGVGTALMVVTLWLGLNSPPPAYGQVPDSGAQRQRMIKEMVTTNEKLTEVVNLLKQIRDQGADASSAKKPAPSGPG